MDGACRRPRLDENCYSLFIRKFTPGDATLRRDVPFAMGVRGFLTNSQFNIQFHNFVKSNGLTEEVETLTIQVVMQSVI